MTYGDILRETARLVGANNLVDDPKLYEYAEEHLNLVMDEIARDYRLLPRTVEFAYDETLTLPDSARWAYLQVDYVVDEKVKRLKTLSKQSADNAFPSWEYWDDTQQDPRLAIYDPSNRSWGINITPTVSSGAFRVHYFKRPTALVNLDTSEPFDGEYEDFHKIVAIAGAKALLELDLFGGPASEQSPMGGNLTRLQYVTRLYEREATRLLEAAEPTPVVMGKARLNRR